MMIAVDLAAADEKRAVLHSIADPQSKRERPYPTCAIRSAGSVPECSAQLLSFLAGRKFFKKKL
jgi:hypothetical protein